MVDVESAGCCSNEQAQILFTANKKALNQHLFQKYKDNLAKIIWKNTH